MLHEIRGDPSKFDMRADSVELLDRAVLKMEETITAGVFKVKTQPFVFLNNQSVVLVLRCRYSMSGSFVEVFARGLQQHPGDGYSQD